MDIDRNGVVWASLSSGHLASFDRRKCKGPLNGPKATGKHCPEGWTLYPLPGPQFENVKASGSVESSYYTWVDQFDTFGLGTNVPIATGNLNDALLRARERRVRHAARARTRSASTRSGPTGASTTRTPAGKAKGCGRRRRTRAPFHMEGGQGTRPKVVKFQLRPDPLAR